MKLKDDSVDITSIQPGLLVALMVADGVYSERGYECVLTSGRDGTHSTTSLHYAGAAVDLRVNNVPAELRPGIRDSIKHRLNQDFDVLLEDDHIHIELQPRRH